MTQEHRRHDRQSVSLAGVLKVDANPDVALRCLIEDLSVGGARVRLIVAGTPQIGNGTLEIESFGAWPVDVAWSRPPHLGLKFREGPEAMAEILAGIAMQA